MVLALYYTSTAVTADAGYSRCAIYADSTDSPASNSDREVFALLGTTRTKIAGSTAHGNIYGLRFSAQHRGTGTLTGAHGIHAYVYMDSAGIITTANGIMVAPWFTAGTVTTFNGINVSAPSGTGGTITNLRGISVSDYTVATNNTLLLFGTGTTGNWMIYGNSTKQSCIGGNLRIGGVTAPTVALDVTGAALISTTLGVTGVLTASSTIINDDIVKPYITVGGNPNARTFTVNVRKFDNATSSNARFVLVWHVSTSAYGSPGMVGGTQTLGVTTGTNFGTASSSTYNIGFTDSSGNFVVQITNGHGLTATSLHFHCYVMDAYLTANGTLYTTGSS